MRGAFKGHSSASGGQEESPGGVQRGFKSLGIVYCGYIWGLKPRRILSQRNRAIGGIEVVIRWRLHKGDKPHSSIHLGNATTKRAPTEADTRTGLRLALQRLS